MQLNPQLSSSAVEHLSAYRFWFSDLLIPYCDFWPVEKAYWFIVLKKKAFQGRTLESKARFNSVQEKSSFSAEEYDDRQSLSPQAAEVQQG